MSTLHTIATCPHCGVLAEGEDADRVDRAAHLHTTSKAKGHERHPSTVRTHPTSQCHPPTERTRP